MNIMSIAWSIWILLLTETDTIPGQVGQWHCKNYTIAGGRQHGLQACTVSFLPPLVKQEIWEQTIMEHSDSFATMYLSPALPIPSKTELTHQFQTYS